MSDAYTCVLTIINGSMLTVVFGGTENNTFSLFWKRMFPGFPKKAKGIVFGCMFSVFLAHYRDPKTLFLISAAERRRNHLSDSELPSSANALDRFLYNVSTK